MRNIIQEPISKEEIIACLRTLALQLSNENPPIIGDMRPLLLSMAAGLVQKSDYPDEAQLKAEYNPHLGTILTEPSTDMASRLGETGENGWGTRRVGDGRDESA